MSPYETIAAMFLLVNTIVSIVTLCYVLFGDNKK